MLVAFLVFAVSAGKVDAPQRSYVIGVLAGEIYRRPARALQLLDQGFGRRVLIDVPASAQFYESTQVELAENHVHDFPQAPSVGICPIEGLLPREEEHGVEKCLAHKDGSRIPSSPRISMRAGH